MTTIQGNEIIAKFMNCAIKPDGIYRWRVNDGTWASEGLKYNSSWDWLMPVLEKIANHVYEDYVTDEKGIMDGQHVFDTAYPRTFAMINAETKNFMVRINRFPVHESPKLIEATWLSVIDFIQSFDGWEKK